MYYRTVKSAGQKTLPTEACYFPMEYFRVTQEENNPYSHKGSLAMDFGGKDTGKDKLYAPCTMKIERVRENANGEVYATSVNPVSLADGTKDYVTFLFMHDSNIKVKEGQIVKQGEFFYEEGGMGSGNKNKFRTHVHIERARGKLKNLAQYKNSYGTYVIENQRHLKDIFILKKDCVILGNNYGFHS